MNNQTRHAFQATLSVSLMLCCGAVQAQQYFTFVQSSTSQPAHWPANTIVLASPMKVVGGGAQVTYTGGGNLLTQTQPGTVGENSWMAAAKDHMVADLATLTVYAIGLRDPNDDWEVGIFSQTSALAAHPTVTASLPGGYALTGGGCKVNWQTPAGYPGNLLTASFPASLSTWECRSKDHQLPSPATVTAYVIGIRPKNPLLPLPAVQITSQGSPVAPHPTAVVMGAYGWIVTGGGALAQSADSAGAGQLLTADQPVVMESNSTLPTPIGWRAESKDHGVPGPGTVRAFAINLRFSAPLSRADLLQNRPVKEFTRDPVKIQIKEVPRSGSVYKAASGDLLTQVVRWEGEDVYFFSSRAPNNANSIWRNPYAFAPYLLGPLGGVSVAEAGQPWQAIAVNVLPNQNGSQFTPVGDANNSLALSPAQGPMLIDHGRKYNLTFTDAGLRSSKPPIASTYKFTYVAPNRCRITSFSLSSPTPQPNTPVTASVSAGPSCKRVELSISGSSTPLVDAVQPDIGSTASPSASYTIRTNTPQTSKLVTFYADAYDAMGRRDGASIIARTVSQSTMPPAACPGNPGGLPQPLQFCASCPSGYPDEPNKYSISGDYCSAATGMAEIQPQYGGCTVTAGPC